MLQTKLWTALLATGLAVSASAAQQPAATGISTPAQSPEAMARVRLNTVATALVAAYDPEKGTFRGTGWWNSANGVTALADAARLLHSTAYQHLFADAFAAAQTQAPDFRNEYYDDEGWWALAWLDVYRSQQDPRFLAMAQSIFADMQGGWSDTCGGGIWWKKDVHYKNAIANELFLSVAVGLAQASPPDKRAAYFTWAQREKNWFLRSGLINKDSLVNDGLTDSCSNNGKTTWTYNQGVLIGGLVGLHHLTGDQADLKLASRIASAATTQLVDANGVLHDPCEPGCGADGVQFKGILVRNLVSLQAVAPDPEVAHAVQASADSAWLHARTANGNFACNWSGPPVDDHTGALISVLDLFNAQFALNK